MLKTIVSIEVPDVWLQRMSAQSFKIAMNNWLESNAPCEICNGHGVGKHVPGYDDPDACPVCEYEEWVNPLL